jgi:nitrite reductase/ring-hydroxylating ferredoxin subunit
MQHAEQVRVIRGLLHHLDTDSNVDAGRQILNPVESYTCPTRAAREWTTFFEGHPQVLGLSADLPKPGTFVTSNDLGRPILATRDSDSVFRAFLNVCRHRGTVVENEARGEKRLFSCPFHAWGYDNRGALVAVPKENHFGAVARDCHGLVALPAEERYGLLWVHPEPAGQLDVDACLGGLAAEFASWRFQRFEFSGATRYDHAMNWKLAIDTFGETYHFNVLHRNTLATDFYGNVQMYDTFGRNHRMMLCLRNIDALRNEPESAWDVLNATLPVYYLFPNVQLILGRDGPILVRIYPERDDPHHSHTCISFYTDPELTEAPDGERYENVQARMQGFADIIQHEDYRAAASSHIGIASGAQRHLIFGRNEPALHHYHNTYRAALGLAPLESA